jgi:hypothetical protein
MGRHRDDRAALQHDAPLLIIDAGLLIFALADAGAHGITRGDSHMNVQQSFQEGGFFRSRTGLACLVFIGVAAFYLLTEHTAHVFGYWPYALFLLCPLMHVFMHGGHGNSANETAPAGHTMPPREDDR